MERPWLQGFSYSKMPRPAEGAPRWWMTFTLRPSARQETGQRPNISPGKVSTGAAVPTQRGLQRPPDSTPGLQNI